VIANAADDGRVYARRGGGAWKSETLTRGCALRAIHGAGDAVWASGDCGLVLRRATDGRWKEERRQRGASVFGLWAAAPDDVYGAAIELLHSRGDGTWRAVATGSPRVFALAGGGGDVYALGTDGVYRGSGGKLEKMSFDAKACTIIAAGAGTLHCFRERRVPLKPPP